MTKKFSSFKNQQILAENWRKFAHPQPTQLEEEIMEILNQVNEGDLNEGALEVMGRVAKKLGLDKLLLIGALMAPLAPSDAHAGIVDDINAFGNDVKIELTKVATQAKDELEARGIEINQDGKAVKSTETVAEKEWNDVTFKTLKDASKAAAKSVDPTGKKIKGGLENPSYQEYEYADGDQMMFKTKRDADDAVDQLKRDFKDLGEHGLVFAVKVGSRGGGSMHHWIIIGLDPA